MDHLRILLAGSVPDELRRDLAQLDPGVELVETNALDRSLHLVVLGHEAPFDARAIASLVAPGEEPIPVLALGEDREADLCLGALPRNDVLRLARRLAGLRREAGRGPGQASPGALRDDEFFRRRLQYEFARALRYRHPVSLVTLSVDGMEHLARLHGATAVSEFLDALEETLRRGLRDVDLLFRAEQQEIFAILPETPANGATLVADRFLAQTSRLVYKPAGNSARPALPLKTTSSIGIADGPGKGVATSEELLSLARESMGSARLAGGGRIVVHGLDSALARVP